MANKIQVRRGIKSALPTLSVGEPGFTTDAKELFIGTGSENIELAKKEYVDTQMGNVANEFANYQASGAGYNWLRNGCFRFWQRGTSFKPNGVMYTADGWRCESTFVDGSIDQVGNSMQFKATSLGTGNKVLNAVQFLEDASPLLGSKATFSVYLKKDASFTSGNLILVVSSTGGNPLGNVVISANELTADFKRFSITVDVPQSATGYLRVMVGGHYLWASFPNEGAAWYATNAKFEIGDKATPFVPRPVAEELAPYERYAQPWTVNIQQYTQSVAVLTFPLPSAMRIPPTMIGTVEHMFNIDSVVFFNFTNRIEMVIYPTAEGTIAYIGHFLLDAEM